MSQAAKAQEPSMEEILASIRRIIADDDGVKAPAKPEAKTPEAKTPEVKPAAKAPEPPIAVKSPPPAAMKQDDIDAMLAGLDESPEPAPPPPPARLPEPDVLELTEAMQAPAATFRKIDGTQDVVFDEFEAHPRRPPAPPSLYVRLNHRRRRSVSSPPPPRPPSIRRSMRSPTRCWCRTPRRWKIS